MPKYVIFALYNFKQVMIKVESWEEWEKIYKEYNTDTSSLEMMEYISVEELKKKYPTTNEKDIDDNGYEFYIRGEE